MQHSIPPPLPTPSDEELEAIRFEQESQLYALVDSCGLEGGLEEALARFTCDIAPLESLLPSCVPEKWFGVTDFTAMDAEVRRLHAHYFDEPKSRGLHDPGTYATTQMMMDFTAQALRELGRLSGPQPLAANVPNGGIGATITSIPGSERAVMFYPSGLYIFGGDFANVVSYFFQEIDPSSIRSDTALRQSSKFAAKYRGYADWIVEVLAAAIVEDHPIRAPRMQTGRAQGFLSMQLHNHAQMFVFAHEIGHQELGHLDVIDPAPEQFVTDELAADRYAMESVCEIAQATKGSWALGFWGCQLALLGFELLDHALKILDGRPKGAQWSNPFYPTIAARRGALAEAAREIAEPDALAAAEHVVTMTCQALNELQRDVELKLYMMKKMLRNIEPAPIWRAFMDSNYGPRTEDAR